MAIYVKPAPVLKGEAAARFLEDAYLNETVRKGTIDLSKQREQMKRILERSKKYSPNDFK